MYLLNEIFQLVMKYTVLIIFRDVLFLVNKSKGIISFSIILLLANSNSVNKIIS